MRATRRLHAAVVSSGYAVMKDVVQGLRPTDAFVSAYVQSLLDQGKWQRAAVEVLSARVLQTALPTDLLLRLLDQAMRTRYDASHQKAIERISDVVMFGPAATARATGVTLEPSPALSGEQMETLLQTLSHYHLPDRTMMVFEHALWRGWSPTPKAVAAAIEAVADKIENQPERHWRGAWWHDPEYRRYWFHRLQALAEVTGTQGDAHVAVALVKVLLGLQAAVWRPHLGRFTKRAGATVHYSSLGALAAARAGSSSSSSSSSQSSSSSTETLRHREENANLKLAFELVKVVNKDALASSRFMPVLMRRTLLAGRRDLALSLFSGMQKARTPVPVDCYNLMLEAEASAIASGGAGDVRTHLTLMRDASVQPDAGTVIALAKCFVASQLPRGAAGSSSAAAATAAASRTTGTGSASPARGVAQYVVDTAAVLGVPLANNPNILGFAAFQALQVADFRELEAVVALAHELPRLDGAPEPRWLRKVASYLADLAASDGDAAGAAAAARGGKWAAAVTAAAKARRSPVATGKQALA